MIKKFLKKILNWLRAIWHWLTRASTFWITVGVSVLGLIIALHPNTTEPIIRWCGMVMDILGLSTVLWGIAKTQATFGHPTLFQVAKNWLKSFPHFGSRIVSANMNVTLGGVTCSARGYAIHGAVNPSIKSRLDALEKNIGTINQRIDDTQRELDTELRKMKTNLKEEEQNRQNENRAIRDQLEATALGGVHVSIMGCVWLLVGIVLSNASQEIFQWLN
jgi:hypothetical protein